MVPLSGSLKVMLRTPVPVSYEDDTRVGGVMSDASAARTVTPRPRTAPMALPGTSRTAPSIMYSIGADPTASICAASRVASRVVPEAVPMDIWSRVYRWTGPVTVISG